MDDQFTDESCSKPAGDVQSRNSDSLTNLYEGSDGGSAAVETFEELITDDGGTSTSSGTEVNATSSVDVVKGDGDGMTQTVPEVPEQSDDAQYKSIDETTVSVVPDVHERDDREVAELHETEQKTEESMDSETNQEREQPTETDETDESTETTGELKTDEYPQTEETIEWTDTEVKSKEQSCVRDHLLRNEVPGSDDPATSTPATEMQLADPTSTSDKPEDILPTTHNENVQALPSSSDFSETVRTQFENDGEDSGRVEPSNIETALMTETRDSETGDFVSQATAARDLTGDTEEGVESVTTNGFDAVGLESTDDDEFRVSHNVDVESSEIEYRAAGKHVLSAEDTGMASILASEQPTSRENDALSRDSVEYPIDAAAAAADDDDAHNGDVGKTELSHQSISDPVQSTRDVFVEQQVAAAGLAENVCVQCDKRVYEMEKIVADQTVYHKTCFRCSHCNRVLSIANFACMEGHIYCRPHFMEIFMTKGTYDDSFAVAKDVDIAPYIIGDYGDGRATYISDADAIEMVPLETVRGLYEKLSREAVEAQSLRTLPERRYQQETGSRDSRSHIESGDLETRSRDTTPMSTKSVVQRTAAARYNGRATSAPTTPVHRPLDVPSSTDDDQEVAANELPQRGLTQALVAQWREVEERAKSELMTRLKTGTSRSRSLSGLALRRGNSPSPSRLTEQGRSEIDDPDTSEDSDMEEENRSTASDDVDEQGRSRSLRHQKTSSAEQTADVMVDPDDEEHQMPPPLLTQYMLAKFRDLESERQIVGGLQAKDKKAFKWEVKPVAPLVRGVTGAAYGDVPAAIKPAGHDAGSAAAVMLTTDATTTTDDELPEPGTTRNLLAKFQSMHTTKQ